MPFIERNNSLPCLDITCTLSCTVPSVLTPWSKRLRSGSSLIIKHNTGKWKRLSAIIDIREYFRKLKRILIFQNRLTFWILSPNNKFQMNKCWLTKYFYILLHFVTDVNLLYTCIMQQQVNQQPSIQKSWYGNPASDSKLRYSD